VNSYTGLHARVYDEIYADKPYADEARFVHELVGSPGGRLLDVACGTGRHAIAFADLGYDVTASDINEELLAVGRAAAGERVRFVQADMCDLDVDGGPFDVVTCLFDSIGYPQHDERIVSALRSLGRHAAPGGQIVCEFLHAPAILRGAEPLRVRQLVLPDGRTLLRSSQTAIDVERMLMHVRYELWALDGDGRGEHAEEEQTNRLFSAPEMRALATAAGLDVREIVPAYADGPIDADTFHLLLVAEPGT
jgi:SAM-dependent methyltransferase